MTVFILTILDLEFEAVKAHLNYTKECITDEGIVYLKGRYVDRLKKSHTIYLYRAIEMANINAALMSYIGLKANKVDLGLLIGVCGGIKDLNLGDVIVARKVYGYEVAKVLKDSDLSRPELGNLAVNIASRCTFECSKNNWQPLIIDKKPSQKPKAILGVIAAGEKVITSNRSRIHKFIKEKYNDTQAVEMEGIGFVKAAHALGFNQIAVIRGTSDQLGNKNKADAKGYQKIAASNAAAYGFNLVETLVKKPAQKKVQKKSKLLSSLWVCEIPGKLSDHTANSVAQILSKAFIAIQKKFGVKTKDLNFKIKEMKEGSIIATIAVDRNLNWLLKKMYNERLDLQNEGLNLISVYPDNKKSKPVGSAKIKKKSTAPISTPLSGYIRFSHSTKETSSRFLLHNRLFSGNYSAGTNTLELLLDNHNYSPSQIEPLSRSLVLPKTEKRYVHMTLIGKKVFKSGKRILFTRRKNVHIDNRTLNLIGETYIEFVFRVPTSFVETFELNIRGVFLVSKIDLFLDWEKRFPENVRSSFRKKQLTVRSRKGPISNMGSNKKYSSQAINNLIFSKLKAKK